jgi:hypothetical protein
MQKSTKVNVLAVFAALLFLCSIGFAQKKSNNEQTTHSTENTQTTQNIEFKRNEVFSILVPKIVYSKFKDRLETAEKIVVMAKGENVFNLSITNINSSILKEMKESMNGFEMNEREFFSEVLPWIVITGDDGKDIPSYLNSLIEFYKFNPEVLLFAPKSYKEFPSDINIGRFFNFQRELGHIAKI